MTVFARFRINTVGETLLLLSDHTHTHTPTHTHRTSDNQTTLPMSTNESHATTFATTIWTKEGVSLELDALTEKVKEEVSSLIMHSQEQKVDKHAGTLCRPLLNEHYCQFSGRNYSSCDSILHTVASRLVISSCLPLARLC